MAIVGIDLGTTYCAVAHLDDAGRPRTVPNRDGDILTPSAVYLAEDGTAVVGQPALDMALEQPDRVATLMKRRMGLPDFGRPVAGQTFRPETLSAVLLRKLVLDAEAQLGPVSQAVITVPAYFDDTRRKATQDAGRIAGLDVLDILDEPSAAALAYQEGLGSRVWGLGNHPGSPAAGVGEANPKPQTPNPVVLVYDLGGGTFDVTLVKLGKKRFQVLAIEGDVQLGGKDFDDRVIGYAADQFLRQYGSDPRADAQSLAMLRAAAERAKRTLSKVTSTTVTAAHAGHKLSVPLTRDQFNDLTRDLLLRTRLTTPGVVQAAGLTWDQVDKVLMVGGSTHMPMTGQMLAELTGREPDRSLAVSEVVARGAAVHAGIVLARKAREAGLAAAGPLADVVEVSVNAHSLGVEVRSGDELLNNKLVAKNTQLPAAASRAYFTAKEGASKVRVRILQGEAPSAAAAIPVGEVWVDLPPGLPKGAPIQVRCEVQSNGRVAVTALDMTSGRRVQADIHRSGGLSDREIEAEAAWVRTLEVR
jgi:molecular chaperone DnaK